MSSKSFLASFSSASLSLMTSAIMLLSPRERERERDKSAAKIKVSHIRTTTAKGERFELTLGGKRASNYGSLVSGINSITSPQCNEVMN